jgi:hypothetical protein
MLNSDRCAVEVLGRKRRRGASVSDLGVLGADDGSRHEQLWAFHQHDG